MPGRSHELGGDGGVASSNARRKRYDMLRITVLGKVLIGTLCRGRTTCVLYGKDTAGEGYQPSPSAFWIPNSVPFFRRNP